jgi:hypothetical protein
MFMNYMDYVDDAAMFMFTAGQVTRMQAALDGSRSSIGTAIPCGGIKLKFTDEPVTLKFRDDPITTLKFRDDPITTLKFRDDPITTLKCLDDPLPTLKFRADPIGTIKAFDDPIGTIKAFDDPIGTNKALDDVKLPALDEPGFQDPLGPVVNPVAPGVGRAPFVLATPHHSDAWQRAAGAQGAADLAAYEQRLGEYEMALREYATAEQSGGISGQERADAEAIYAEYVQLASEYQRLRGGGM